MLIDDDPIIAKAIELDEFLLGRIRRWPRGNASLADQLKTASEAIGLRYGEGLLRRSFDDRINFFNIARASASEVAVALRYAVSRRLVTDGEHAAANQLCDQLSRMIWKRIVQEERAAEKQKAAKHGVDR